MFFYLAIVMVIGHFLGDWLCQTRKMAENKSKKLLVLGLHSMIANFVLVMFIFCFVFVFCPDFDLQTCLMQLLQMFFCLFLFHMFVDRVVWHTYIKLRKEHHYDKIFFDVIAVDQILHMVSIFYIANLFI